MLIIHVCMSEQFVPPSLSHYVPLLHPQQYPTNVQTKNMTSTRGPIIIIIILKNLFLKFSFNLCSFSHDDIFVQRTITEKQWVLSYIYDLCHLCVLHKITIICVLVDVVHCIDAQALINKFVVAFWGF